MHVTSTLTCNAHAMCRLLILDIHSVDGVLRSNGMMRKSETCCNLALHWSYPSECIHKHYCPMHEGFFISEGFCSGTG